jgi:hypothetical protein
VAVTDDPSIVDEDDRRRDVRDHVRKAGGYAPAIYAADKASKVRELRVLLAHGADPAETESKRRHYSESLAMLEEVIPGSRVVELLRFELGGARPAAARVNPQGRWRAESGSPGLRPSRASRYVGARSRLARCPFRGSGHAGLRRMPDVRARSARRSGSRLLRSPCKPHRRRGARSPRPGLRSTPGVHSRSVREARPDPR